MILDHVILQEVLNRIEAKYGGLENECGGYISTDNGYEWLSVANIVEIILHVDEIFE